MKTRHVLITVVGVIVAALLLTPVGATASQFKDVIVRNTVSEPVPTSPVGTTAVSGSVSVDNLPATQQVGGTVGIDPAANTVQVHQAPVSTTLILGTTSSSRVVTPTDNALESADVAAYRTVRLNATTFSGTTECRYSLIADEVTLAEFTLGQFQSRSVAFDVPGTRIALVVETPGSCFAWYQLYGRTD